MDKDKQLTVLVRLFNEVDPVGLASEEAPNEYLPEVKELMSLSPNFSDADELHRVIKDVFARYFEGVKIRSDLLAELAQKIHKAFQHESFQ
jgi:hypothetical protein